MAAIGNVIIRNTPEFAGWLDRFAKFRRLPKCQIIEDALKDAAKAAGFHPPPDRITRP